MTSLNRKTRTLLGTAAKQLRPHLFELSSNWKQSYREIYPDDPEQIVRHLDQLNIGTLADCLEKGDLNACYENVSYHGRRLAKLGVPEEKVAASLQLYLREARALLRTRLPHFSDTDRIVEALEQLQLVEMMVARQSYSHLEHEGTEAIISVMDAQLSSDRLDEFLSRLLSLSVAAMRASSGRIILMDEEQPEQVRMQFDTARPRTRRQRVDRARRQKVDRVLKSVLERGEPGFVHAADGKLTLARSQQARSIWLFPIQVKGRTIGVLLLRFTKYYECLPKEREVMESLMARAALAIDRALLLDRIRTSEMRIRELTEHIMITQDEERRRISRELHDETSHSLLVLKLYLEMIYKELPRNLRDTRQKAKEAAQLVEKTLKELRRLISDLGPAMLDDYGLVGAVKWYIKTMHDFFNMKVHFHLGKDFPRLPRNLEVAVYRIVQEALNNAARHSQAREVDVSLKSDTESVTIVISDNGIGFNPERLAELKRKRTFGLLGMKERVTLLGGSFQVESQVGRGTQIRVSLPVVVR